MFVESGKGSQPITIPYRKKPAKAGFLARLLGKKGPVETVDFDAAMRAFPVWVRKQDPNESYCYGDNQRCALATYFTALGYENVGVGPGIVRMKLNGRRESFTYDTIGLEDVLIMSGTFGRLAEKLPL
jgi:hypothetical protein